MEAGCRLAAKYDVASVCVRPADVTRAKAILDGTDVKVGTTIGFPHGNHATETKVFEARRALADGATELDMVLQIGALKSGRDQEVEDDIRAVVEVAHAAGAIVKVIFENAYLTDDEKIRACRLTEAAGGDFVKTSTGFAPSGATHDDLRLMRANTSPHVQVKAAGGVRTLDALLDVMELGVTRIGATATEAMILRLPGAQGGPGPGDRGARPRREATDEPRADRDAGLRLHRGVPRPGAALRARRPVLTASCDANAERRERLRRAVRRPAGTPRSRSCARIRDVDLVVVSLPNHLHREAVLALGRGRQGASRAPSRSAATRTRPRTCCAP